MATNKNISTNKNITDELNNLLIEPDIKVDDVLLKKNDTFKLFNHEIDKTSTLFNIIGIVLWFTLFYLLDLYKYLFTNKYITLVFIMFIVFCVYNAVSSSIYTSDITSEQNKLYNIEQTSIIILGTLVFFVIAAGTNWINWNNKKLISHLLCISIILSIIQNINLSTSNNAVQLRSTRKLKEVLFNITLGIVLLAVVFIASDK